MRDYEFRPCRPEEAAEVFRLIRERTRWMDEVGICQWNHTDYLNVFPLSYYEEQQAEGTLYALCERQTGKLAAAAPWSSRAASSISTSIPWSSPSATRPTP